MCGFCFSKAFVMVINLTYAFWILLRKYILTTLAIFIVLFSLDAFQTAWALADEIYKFVRERLSPSKQFAVVIGINGYDNKRDLSYAVNDARAMIKTLRVLGYIIDEDAILLQKRGMERSPITRKVITKAILKTFKKTGPRDRVVVFYAGHGEELFLKDDEREALLLPSDYDPDDPVGSGLPFRDLVNMAVLKEIKAKQILFILDACYAGDVLKYTALRNDSPPKPTKSFYEDLLNKEAYLVLTAGGDGQQVSEKLGYGVFTQQLMRGLAGAADNNSDGVVHFNELVTWLEPIVYEMAKPLEQNVAAGRIRSGLGQPVFVVPSINDRHSLLGENEGAEISIAMQDRCKELGNICPWLTPSRGTEKVTSDKNQVSPPASVSGFDPRQMDLAFWNSISDIDDPVLYEEYLKKFPDGVFVAIARRKLKLPVHGFKRKESYQTDSSNIHPTTGLKSKFGLAETPILRTEIGAHTNKIPAISVDRKARYLVSGSYDKTARVWDVNSGRLIQTLRIPIGSGPIGRIYAVAISPNGDRVAVGGWTGKSPEDQSIYLFDRSTGRMDVHLGGLSAVVNHLVFSKDDRYLAASLGRNDGIRIYDMGGYKEIAMDKDYADAVNFADFDAHGRLVTASSDGKVRLYNSKFNLISSRDGPGGKRPHSAVFSPDDKKIAVGYSDSIAVDVLSGDDLSWLYSPDTKEFDNGNLSSVAWSVDGKSLYAGGTYDVDGLNPVIRWSNGGLGSERFLQFAMGTNTVMGIKPLPEGWLAMADADSLLAVLYKDGGSQWLRRSDIADFRGQAIRLSESSDIVEFGYKQSGQRPARFSFKALRLEINPPLDGRLSGPITEASGLKITDWKNKYTPKLNGKSLALSQYESSRSLAISPDHKSFLLGTEWYLRLFDRNGKQVWIVDPPSVAWAVNISGDGKRAVAGCGDGTLRWYRMSDGKELLALFPHEDGKRWIAWTPQGFYQASADAEDLIGWHLNHGSNQTPDFYGASRFRQQFYRPDVVARVLDTLDVKEALALADQARGTKTLVKDVKSILPPTITILSPAAGTQTTSNKLTVFYKAESTTGAVTEVEARIQGRPAKVLDHIFDHEKGDGDNMMGQITIVVPPEDVNVSLIARNKHGDSEPATYLTNWTGAWDWYKPNLYVLAVGVSRYDQKHLKLKYAAKDAQDFIEVIKTQKGGLYKQIKYRLLVSNDHKKEATRDNILDGLEWLMRETTSRDVAMVFLSGHGTNDSDGNYNFLPQDGDPARLRRTCIEQNDFKKFISSIPGITLLFMDSSGAGDINIEGVKRFDQDPEDAVDQVLNSDVEKLVNELADASSGGIVFSASTGRQLSFEKDELRNGVFTEALLEGIMGRADYKKDLYISVAELELYISERVRELTKGEQMPVIAKPKAFEDFKIIRVYQPISGG